MAELVETIEPKQIYKQQKLTKFFKVSTRTPMLACEGSCDKTKLVPHEYIGVVTVKRTMHRSEWTTYWINTYWPGKGPATLTEVVKDHPVFKCSVCGFERIYG